MGQAVAADKRYMKLPRNDNLNNQAKALRKNMTPQERHLWYDFLRQYPVKIYKQKIIGNYIADFYCHKAKLVFELDGSQHYTESNLRYDKIRTKYFNSLGIDVIRFTNNDIDNNFDYICIYIDKIIKERHL